MSAVSERVERSLRDIVGEDRIRTDQVERKMYSFDIGAMPKLVKPFVAAGIAGAVVRPRTEEQVVELVKFASREGVELVPRGWATSGYGGVLPKTGAVVVDMTGMNRILEIDPENKTVRVQASAIWEVIEREINKDGLSLRLYPSSTPSSGAAGWLAQGGAGFGSFEYGTFKENVLSARVVLPSGEVKVFEGTELLSYVADAEGITGIITELTVALRALEPEVHRALAFPDGASIGAALSAISVQKLPVWSITFLNPESMKLKTQLPHRHGHPWEEAHKHADPELPEAYIAVIAYPESRRGAIDDALAAITESNGGTDLGPEAAEHEWELRFAPMRLKRIGPSIVPTEVVVPLAQMSAVLTEIDEKIKQPFILEGMHAKGDNIVLLGFIPHDERSFAFNLAFALSLTVIKIAKEHGGSAYSTGAYFRREAESVLGAAKVKALTAYKSSVDSKNVMNPGKVFGSGLIDVVMGTAAALEPVVRVFANAAKPPQGPGDLSKEKNGIPGEVAFMAYACARCGYCVPTCEQYSGRGWESHSPRGKYAFIREVLAGREKFDRKMVDTFLVCTTCEVCNDRCQLQLPVEHNWMAMRGQLVHKEKRGTFPPFEMIAASLESDLDIWAGKRENRANWVPEDIAPKLTDENGGWNKQSDYLYFAGCTASFVETDVAEASVRLLTDAGYDMGYMGTDEACCGIPMKVSGKWDDFERIYRHNTTEARKRGAKTIVASCPACALVWKEMYANLAAELGEEYEFEVKHYSELVAEALGNGTLELKNPIEGRLTFHDSCHAGRAQGLYEPPRDMLKAIPGVDYVEMEHNREEGYCCGSVLTLIGEAPIAPILGKMRLDEAIDVKADTVVALCPCCQVQLRDSNIKNDMGLKVDDLARVVAQAAGYDIPESTEHAMYMWGYFEKFIILMEPANMAALMEKIFPEMMDAMPVGMKPMMKSMKYVPGGLSMMEKMMPMMFPMMIDGIMAKVMPDMIKAVEEYIGMMPEDMAELMPDLLPKTMQSLMPTYLPELIPFVTPRMIEYIKSEM
ncbi:MAG: FAD-binding and (Fe-S)-binding domain-containing protein [Actinomycetota bacterium]|jgi:Fe-S oxidoreductase/FAD/FMN-containing dehydrogenase|nr:FAD-binding and (Fe-S)-binding domain-containing protein [Actinomycetota bacterium]